MDENKRLWHFISLRNQGSKCCYEVFAKDIKEAKNKIIEITHGLEGTSTLKLCAVYENKEG